LKADALVRLAGKAEADGGIQTPLVSGKAYYRMSKPSQKP